MENTIDFKNWDQGIFEYKLSRNFEGFRDQFIEVVQGNATRLHNLFARNKLWFTLKYVENELSLKELTTYFRHAMQSSYAHIITEENITKDQEVWVADKKVLLKKSAKGQDTSVDKLMDFFFIASICRCKKVIEAVLRQTDPGPFFHNVNLSKSYHYPYYYLEKSLHKIDETIIERQLESMNMKAEGFFKHDDEWNDWYHAIYIPLSELRKAFYLRDEASFNEKLQAALDKDRAFNDDEKGRYANPDNWLPWEIISFACRAFDKGWNITVEDSRLPVFLVEGKCIITNLAP
ncbi:immunity 49 family protein [Kordia sp.]|uniref:immunity 49 family protein n=1 Tax=Kordia sp. TaxID=1965332 RepID=UPI0025B90DFF|nr:immunity 49 family protein [Kordia sp.]MCH2193513.1 immunity 49 family protein [Kordia sp.]